MLMIVLGAFSALGYLGIVMVASEAKANLGGGLGLIVHAVLFIGLGIGLLRANTFCVYGATVVSAIVILQAPTRIGSL